MLYEQSQKRYVDITSTIKDLMKLKIVQWTITCSARHVLQNIEQCTMDVRFSSGYCSNLQTIYGLFHKALQKKNFHALLLKKQHYQQLKRMQFEDFELERILRDYVRIGGRFATSIRERRLSNDKRFVVFDEENIDKISRKKCKRTC